MNNEVLNIYEKLAMIQHELKAPKGQYNSFGKYKYRSCEDILEAVKPICFKYKTTLVLSDEIICVGDRYYIKATATIYDNETNSKITDNITTTKVENTAYARESLEKKGMDDSQITGTASSYARKYALNGLFNIDDTKDADTNEYHEQTEKEQEDFKDVGEKYIGKDKLDIIKALNINPEDAKAVLTKYGYQKSNEIKVKDFKNIYEELKSKEAK